MISVTQSVIGLEKPLLLMRAVSAAHLVVACVLSSNRAAKALQRRLERQFMLRWFPPPCARRFWIHRKPQGVLTGWTDLSLSDVSQSPVLAGWLHRDPSSCPCSPHAA